MEDNKKMTNEKIGKDPVVTAVSLIVIAVQSVIIILGFIYRWDWLAYECAAMLIIPAAIVLFYGVKAVIDADRLMTAGIKELEEEKEKEELFEAEMMEREKKQKENEDKHS